MKNFRCICIAYCVLDSSFFFLVYAYRMSFEPVYFSARSYFFAYCYSDKKKKK